MGIDLGPNSIGWALVDDGEERRLIDCGVRVFPEGVDAFDTAKESSRNEQRRTARMMRRQILRRRRRRRRVTEALVEAGLLPENAEARRLALATDPYPVRDRAIRERLEPFEIGRVLYHLNQRRGFLSLRKSEAARKKEVSGMLKEMDGLKNELGERTLGQYLLSLQHDAAGGSSGPVRLRGRHTRREMIEDEFLRIWKHQRTFHPDLLTDGVLYGSVGAQDASHPRPPMPRDASRTWLQQFGLHGLVFHQRPIYWPRSMIGMCELEKGARRCPRADRAAQRFRMLQELNNLRWEDPLTHEERGLDAEQRAALLDYLARHDKLEFDRMRKLLGFIDSVKFNLERGDRKSIKGHETDRRVAKAFGEGWFDLPDATRDGVVRELIHADLDEAAAQRRLQSDYRLASEVVERLLRVDLPAGYVRFSRRAIEKLLPHLERGLVLMGKTDREESAMHAAGYCRPDEITRRLFDRLPSLDQIRSGPLADLPNPVVKAALYELRRVVNAIVREHGKPDAIHVEMARSLKMSHVKRQEYSARVQERGRERDQVASLLREKGLSVSREAILRYQLWQEQDHRCVYSGRAISFEQLYGGEIDVDHILPYSRTLDDSQSNKVVCFRDANRDKGQRSPAEWLAGSDPARLEQILQHARSLPWTKRRRLSQKEVVLDEFIARQLVDTGYIARLAVVYLKLIIDADHDVQGRKGEYTAELRHQWGLDNILQELPDSPAWQARNDLRPGEKNRADHRHHAIDAIVIALTNRSRLHHLARIRREGGVRVTGERLPDPWTDFRQSVLDRIRAVNVSHRVRRGVRGALHEDTFYGPVRDRRTGQPQPEQFVVRKPLDALSLNEIERIRDAGIRRLVMRRLEEHGIAFGRGAEGVSPKRFQEALRDLRMPSGVPIRRVRVLRKDGTICPIRAGRRDEAWVKPGKTHHLCIFEWDENDRRGRTRTVRDAVFVTMLEARRRIHLGQPIVQRVHPQRPDARFVLSLSPGELVLGTIGESASMRVWLLKTSVATEQKLTFASATDARKSRDYQQFRCTINTLGADVRKVTVDPLGRIRWAND